MVNLKPEQTLQSYALSCIAVCIVCCLLLQAIDLRVEVSSLESKLSDALSDLQELDRERNVAVAEHQRLVEENKEVGGEGKGREGGEGKGGEVGGWEGGKRREGEGGVGRGGRERGGEEGMQLTSNVISSVSFLQLQSRYEQELVQHANAVQSLTEVKEEVRTYVRGFGVHIEVGGRHYHS